MDRGWPGEFSALNVPRAVRTGASCGDAVHCDRGHLPGRGSDSRAGNPSGFEPDGDSIQFQPTNPSLLERLQVLDRPARLTSISSTQHVCGLPGGSAGAFEHLAFVFFDGGGKVVWVRGQREAEQGAVEHCHVGALPYRRHQVRGIAEQRDAYRRRPGQADRESGDR